MNPKEDFIFYRDEKNNIFSGGYKLDNIFKKLDIPPHGQKKTGGSNLIVPAGLFLLQQNIQSEEETIPKKNISNKIIGDDFIKQVINAFNTRKGKKKIQEREETHTNKLTRKNKKL